MPVDIHGNVARLQDSIAGAASRAGRLASAVRLVAVTKTHPPAAVLAAAEAGLRDFGENRVEEGLPKMASLAGSLPPDVTWHMIGHIQSRKTDEVPQGFSWVHSVDRFKIARRLSDTALALGRSLDILLEVNVSGEDTKEGYDMAAWPQRPLAATSLFSDIPAIAGLAGLRLRGLMTMAPFVSDPELVRPIFRRMRDLSLALAEAFPACDFSQLSMGMSGDYAVAIEEGATIIRVGTAIFGPRE